MGTELRFIFFSLLFIGCQSQEDDPHYCFANPPEKTHLCPNLLRNITTCTHLVFGKFPIDSDNIRQVFELEPVYELENIRTILGLKSQYPNVKFLLGVQRTKSFQGSASACEFGMALERNVLMKKFDGIFVSFNGSHLEDSASLSFFEGLATEEGHSFWITFNVTGREVFALKDSKMLRKIDEIIEHVYLDMAEIPIKWVLGQKSTQIGASTNGNCTHPPAQLNTIPAKPANCTRLCYLDPEHVSKIFPIDNLKTEYCSHIVVHYFDVDSLHIMEVTDKAKALVQKINIWRSKNLEVAPKLIISLGSKQKNDVWEFILDNDTRRKALAEKLVEAINDTAADGLEISWTLRKMSEISDKNLLKNFIDDVLLARAEKTFELIVAASVWSSYEDYYDYGHLNRTADLIVLHSHRFHYDYDGFTRHPSPLHFVPKMMEKGCSWESIYNHWVDRKVDRSKLVLSLTASTYYFHPLADMRAMEQKPFDQPAFLSMQGRGTINDVDAQEEVCMLLNSENAVETWVPEAEVPYLRMRDGKIITYENTRSAHIKAVWASTEGAGGLALHDIQLDDPNGLCDLKTQFPLLRALSEAQTCQKSPPLRVLPSALTDGNSPTDLEKSAQNSAAINRDNAPIPSKPSNCTRLCYIDPEKIQGDFPFHKLNADDCSHIVVPYFDLNKVKVMTVSKKAENLVQRIEEWRAKFGGSAPNLILSLGSKQKNEVWQFVLNSDTRRQELVETIVGSLNTADGLEISWTLRQINSSFDRDLLKEVYNVSDINFTWGPEAVSSDDDKRLLKTFIDEVVTVKAEKKFEIIVAVTAVSSYQDFYDFEHLNRTADLIVLHSHRFFHDTFLVTRHPSPLHATPGMIMPMMAWESLFNHWVSKNVTKSKLVLSLTASALSFNPFPMTDMLAIEKAPLGQQAMFKFPQNDQMVICQLLNSGNAVEVWIPGAEVPYMRERDKITTYENPQSARIKAVWASMQGAGGLALHNIQLDDPNAFCDNKTHFPILRALSSAQFCMEQQETTVLSKTEKSDSS